MKNFTTEEMKKIERYLKVIGMTVQELENSDFEAKLTSIGVELVRKEIDLDNLDSLLDDLGSKPDSIYEEFFDAPKSILDVINEVLDNPKDYNDAYIGSCVRTKAAVKAVSEAKGFWEESEATLAYAEELQKLKKFW